MTRDIDQTRPSASAWGIWTCGHASEVGREAEHVVTTARGPETHCGTCDAHVLPWTLPVRDGTFVPPTGSQSIDPPHRVRRTASARAVPDVPGMSAHLDRAYEDAVASARAAEGAGDYLSAACHARTALALEPRGGGMLQERRRADSITMVELLRLDASGRDWHGLIADHDALAVPSGVIGSGFSQDLLARARAHIEPPSAIDAAVAIARRPGPQAPTLHLTEVPFCPVALDLVHDPVTLSCGHTLEHASARGLIAHANGEACVCPSCRAEVIPWPTVNLPMREAIDAWHRRQPSDAEPASAAPRMPAVPLPIDATLYALIQDYMRPNEDLEAAVAELPVPAALDRVDAALRDRPHVLSWLALRADLEERSGWQEESLATWSLVLRRDPVHPRAARRLAVRAIGAGQFHRAQQLLERRAGQRDFAGEDALLLAHAHSQLAHHAGVVRYAGLALGAPELGPFERGQALSHRALARLHLAQRRDACRDLAAFHALDIGGNALIQEVEDALRLAWGDPLLQAQLFFFSTQMALVVWVTWLWRSAYQAFSRSWHGTWATEVR